MLVALGFLVAALLALLIAPAFWSRAVKLTTRRIKETLPISDAEVQADKNKAARRVCDDGSPARD